MVLIIDQRFRAGQLRALKSRLILENGEITTMSTLINWLEAGRRLAERISLQPRRPGGARCCLARGPGAISLNHLLWGRAQDSVLAAR